MDNSLHFEQTPYHHVCLKDRLNITGSELTLVRLDQDQNEVSIRGNIDSISYVSDKKKQHPKEKMFNKLLK